MRADIVRFKQEEMAQLALDSEIPGLGIRRRKFALELVISRQRENNRQQFVAIEGKRTGHLCRNTWQTAVRIEKLTLIRETAGEAVHSKEIKEESKISLEWRIRARVAKQVGEYAVVENAEAAADRHLRWTTGQFRDPAAVPGRTVVETEAWCEVIFVGQPEALTRIRRVFAHQLEFESAGRLLSARILVHEGRHLSVHFVRNRVVVPAQAVIQRKVWSKSPGVLEVDSGFTYAVTTIILVNACLVLVEELRLSL